MTLEPGWLKEQMTESERRLRQLSPYEQNFAVADRMENQRLRQHNAENQRRINAREQRIRDRRNAIERLRQIYYGSASNLPLSQFTVDDFRALLLINRDKIKTVDHDLYLSISIRDYIWEQVASTELLQGCIARWEKKLQSAKELNT